MSMRQEPEFYALMDEANADEAYLASLSALYDPAVANDERRLRRLESDPLKFIDVASSGSSLHEVLAAKRESLRLGGGTTRIPFRTRLQKFFLDVNIGIERVKCAHDAGGSRSSLLSVGQTDILPKDFYVPASSCDTLSIPVEAAILGHIWQEHLDQVFLAMCAPDGHSRVKMGVYNVLDKLYGIDLENGIGNLCWHAAVEMAATYHGNHEVARDLAFSWLHLHDGQTIDSVVHSSLDDLIMRVEAAPAGTSIGIASRNEHVISHAYDQSKTYTVPKDQLTVMNWSVGPRPRYPEDDALTREQVLTTLQTPSETLLQALEAVAAAPDPEWVEAEKVALEVLAMPTEDVPSGWRRMDRYEQRCFLEQHAPFEVRRLHNGGVMLVAYPYRYLWPLWARTLDLLGIRPLKA